MSSSREIWEVLQERVAERISLDKPPFRNIVILFEGQEDDETTGLMDIIEVPNGKEDGVLQLLVGTDHITVNLSWTVSTNGQEV